MAKSIKTLVHSIINTGNTLQSQCHELIALASAMTYKAYVNEVAAAVGEFYGVKPHESNKGKLLTFAKDTAAEQKLSKLRQMHPAWVNQCGNAKCAPVAVPRGLVRHVADEVITKKLTKAQFNAFIAELREAVVFA